MPNEFVVKNGLIVSASILVSGNLHISGTIAQGPQTAATAIFSRAHGLGVTASGNYSHAEGAYTRTEAGVSHAEGYYTTASAIYSHVEGGFTSTANIYAHAEGFYTSASGHSSHAEGGYTSTTGQSSHAEGSGSIASERGAHAEGFLTVASGVSAHAEGFATSASAFYAHAEGGHTRATAEDAHAEGTGSVASGVASHAEGEATRAAGVASHAEGRWTSASQAYSHAEGIRTVAIGLYSHAEGENTRASGQASHAEGLGTSASGDYQTVQGKYNATSSTALWIIGDGLSNTDKKNLVTAFRDHLVISGSQSITGSFNSISSSVNVDFGRLNVTSGSIHMNSGTLGTNIYGTASWADQLARGPVVIAASAPAQVPSGGLWWNTNDNYLYMQTAVPSGSTWTSVVNQTTPFASASRTVVSQITPSTYGGTMVISENRLFYVNGTEGHTNYNRGNGSTNGSIFAGVLGMRPINFPGETTATIVSASTYGMSAFALFSNGNLYTWGRNNNGQLGVGDTTDRTMPAFSSANVVDVYWDPSQYHRSPADVHIFMKKTDGKIYGTGYNGFGQLGVGDTTNRSSWTLAYDTYGIIYNQYGPIRRVYPLGAYTGMSVVETTSGSVFTCGYGAYGQLANNATANRSVWQGNNFNDLTGVGLIKEISFGGGDASGFENCNLVILFDNGTNTSIRAAGNNGWGTLGQGTTTGNFQNAVSVPGFTAGAPRVSKMARAGNSAGSIWALREDGTLWNWGYNGHGQLDRGNTTDSGTPTQVETGVLDILYPEGAAYNYGYQAGSPIIRKADGYYRCGYNAAGQLADGTTTNRSNLVKMQFPGGTILTTVGSLSTNSDNLTFYAVDTQNRFWAWGYNANYSIDVNNSNSPVTTPIQLSPGALMR